jgi:hypothetical protein
MMKPYATLQQKLFPTTGCTADNAMYLELILKLLDNFDTAETTFTNPAAEFVSRLQAVSPNHPAIARIKSLLGSQAD